MGTVPYTNNRNENRMRPINYKPNGSFRELRVRSRFSTKPLELTFAFAAQAKGKLVDPVPGTRELTFEEKTSVTDKKEVRCSLVIDSH